MEIIPGVGVELAKVGERRAEVESRVGKPFHSPTDPRAVYDTAPMLVVHYDSNDVVELVEVAYSPDGGEQVFFDGVQLTYRFMDDVVTDLAAKGLHSTPSDIGFDYEPGFAIFSMASLWALDLDPNATEDDERRIVEGVSIAPYEYFTAT